MDSDDACSVGTASTDTSMFLRELQALNTGGTSTSGPISASVTSETLKGMVTGDEENPETLPTAMRTIRGEQPSQVVNFDEDADESSVGIYSRKVEVYVSPVSSSREKAPGSNKVKVTPLVNHGWEHKYFHGNIVAMHKDCDYLAYVLKGKSGGNVRVVSRRTANRNLLKCFNGTVLDIAFALSDDAYLAAVDETGSLFVHSFTMEGASILSNLILHVERETYNIESVFRDHTRVIWCPYMPDEETDSLGSVDVAKMLVLLHGTQAEVWNVEYVAKEHGNNPISSKDVDRGLMCIEPYEPLMPVVNAAFAPDGSAIAVAYFSGLVKFFLVDLEGAADTTCMHEWNPHDGAPVTSLFFLDDHRHTSPEQQLWKFALTGANYNREIKIWSCETWACVQVLRFNAPQSQPDLSMQLKSEVDLTSKYLVLSDIYSRVLYILHIHQDPHLATAHISSLSKFSLTLPCVSFVVFEAAIKKLKRSADDSHLDEITTGELEGEGDVKENGDAQGGSNGEGGKSMTGVQIRMYGIHTKCVQELLIRYRPESSAPPPPSVASISSVSQDEGILRDMLSDVSLDQSVANSDISSIPQQDPSQISFSSPGQPEPNSSSHITPLSSPSGELVRKAVTAAVDDDDDDGRRVESPSPDAANLPSAASSTSSFTYVTAMNEEVNESPLSSIDPSSVMSPGSAFSQTPQKLNVNQSSSSLPPISSCDDEDDDEDDDDDGNEGDTSRISLGSGGAKGNSRDRKEDVVDVSLNETSQSNQDMLDDLFTGSSWQKENADRTGESLESTASSGVVTKQPDRYDEDDQEVAQTLGSTLVSEGFGGPQQEEDDDEEDDDEVEIVSLKEDEEEEEEEDKDAVVAERNVGDKKGAKWPDPPDVSTEAKRLVTEAIQQSTAEEKTEFDDENDEAEIEEILQSGEENDGYPETSEISPPVMAQGMVSDKAFATVESKLSDLADKMLLQQDMLVAMQKELAGQREVQLQLHRQQLEQQQLQQVASQQPSIQEDISKLEDILVTRMEHSLAQHMHKENRLQDSLTNTDQQRMFRDKALQTAMVNETSQTIRNCVNSTLKTEIKQTVTPALHRFVEPMKDKIHQEVAQRLSACDSLLRDNIAKAVKSRSTMDVLANSVGDVIYQQMQQAYTHTFKSAMLPSFSAAMEKTVHDVHAVFQQGTKEYQHYLKHNSDQVLKEERAKAEEIVQRMENAEQQFGQSMNHMKNLIVSSIKDELSGQVAQAVASFRGDIVSDIHRVVKDEVHSAMKDHGASIDDKLTSYLRSAAATPVPGAHNDDVVVSKEKIIRDLRNGHIDEAFQSALSAENLDLVLYACEAVSPMNLFSMTPCPLSQPVLLSLVSQLATNLDQHFDLKMRFLSDAVMSLDTENSRTAEHIPSVLTGLVRCLNAAVKSFSSDPRKVKEIKMLVMAANSLVASRM